MMHFSHNERLEPRSQGAGEVHAGYQGAVRTLRPALRPVVEEVQAPAVSGG